MSSNDTAPASTRSQAEGNKLYQLSLAHPILVPLVLLSIAVIMRIVDIGILRLDEKWGEALLHKALGFALVVGYLWAAGRSVREIGLHRKHAWETMGLAALGTVAYFVEEV